MILCIKVVNCEDYTEMHGQQNVKKYEMFEKVYVQILLKRNESRMTKKLSIMRENIHSLKLCTNSSKYCCVTNY